jgi:hypothetical protein
MLPPDPNTNTYPPDFANSSDNVPSARSFAAGLSQRASSGQPAFYIHTSGTGILTFADARAHRFGAAPSPTAPTYDDWDGIAVVTSLPDDAWHRNVDKIVLAAAAPEGGVKTAIVAPPTISGRGRGPGNQRSIQWYEMARVALERGGAFCVGEGRNEWNWVHVRDLSRVYLSLMEDAMDRVAGKEGGKATWGKEGYYFAETELYVWGDVARLIGKTGKDLDVLKSEEVDGLNQEEAEKLMEGGSLQWGFNSKSKSVRAKKLFGWEPKVKDIKGLIHEIVKEEALALGLLKTHAQEAAGA